MKKLILPFVALLLCMTACQKEDLNLLILEVEQFNGDAKMHIDNQDFAVWDDGDVVWLNENEKHVSVDNDNHRATISAQDIYSPYYASYPYNAIKTTGNSACSITLPEVQTYRENSQHQQIVAAPMLAYGTYTSEAATTLKFRNVGSVLAVKVLNNTYGTLRVHSIQVIADNQNLWGNGNVGLTGEASLFSYNLSNGGNTVTLDCGDGVEVPTEGKVFYIALPTISGAHLTVKVDDGSGIYTRAQTTNTATFNRNTLHQVPFSASEDVCETYAIRPNQIKYTATSKLDGFEADAEVWGKTVLRHDYDGASGKGSITFNSDITEIPSSAFRGNSVLLSIQLPENVETIGNYAFNRCGSLTSVSMQSVKIIDVYAFGLCSSLTTLDCPSINRINTLAFAYSGLDTITLGKDCSSLGINIFLNCSLSNIYCKAQNPPSSDINDGANCFTNMNSRPTTHIPSGARDRYRESLWRMFSNIVEDCPTD